MVRKGRKKRDYEAMKRKCLVLLKEGKSMREIFKLVSIGQSTYYAWAKSDPEFKRLSEIARQQGKAVRRQEALKQTSELVDDGWKRDVLNLYVDCKGVLGDACAKAGADLSLAVHTLDPESEHYDLLFAAEIERLDRVVNRTIEDEALRAMRNGDNTMTRWLLERRVPESYGKQAQRVEVKQDVTFGFDDARAAELLARMFGGDEVVDVEYAEVAAAESGALLAS